MVGDLVSQFIFQLNLYISELFDIYAKRMTIQRAGRRLTPENGRSTNVVCEVFEFCPRS